MQRSRAVKWGLSILCLAVGCGLARSVAAQSAGGTELEAKLGNAALWRHVGGPNGLPDSGKRILEADDGTPWVLLGVGVAWYDGFEWRPVPPALGAPTRRVYSASAIPGSDRLLLAAGGLLYEGNARGFRQVPLQEAHLRVIVAVALDDGSLLVQVAEPTGANRLLRLHEAMEDPVSTPSPIPPTLRANLWRTRAGSIWVNTERGLYEIQEGIWRLRLSAGDQGPLDLGRVREGPDGRGAADIYLPQGMRGVWHWRPETPVQRLDVAATAFIDDLDVTDDGSVLVLTATEALAIGAQGVRTIDADSPLHSGAWLTVGAEGRIWTGTRSGIHLLMSSAAEAWTHWTPPGDAGFARVNDILVRSDGSTWLATEAGLVVQAADGSGYATITEASGAPIRAITGIAEDPAGNLWIVSGSGFTGAYRFDGQAWTHYRSPGQDGAYFHAISVGARGRLWFAGLRGRRYLLRQDPGVGPHLIGDGSLRPWTDDPQIARAQVYDVAEGGDGSLWFATVQGLARHRDGTTRWWTTADGLLDDRVTEVEVGPDGRVWFADQRSGLGEVLDDGTIRIFGTAQGIPLLHVWGIRPEADGSLWLSGRGGVSRMQDGVFSILGGASRLLGRDTWPLARRGDQLLVGTAGAGLATLEPSIVGATHLRARLREVVVQDRTALVQWSVQSLWATTPPEAIENRYRLDGGDWTRWSGVREARFDLLAPGDHLLELQARGSSGEVQTIPQPMSFSVPTPLWRTPAFLVPVATILLGLALLTTHLVVGRRNATREQRVEAERYRRIFESASDFIFTTDNEERFTSINKAGLVALGYRENEVLGRPVSDFLAPESQRLARQMRRAKLRGLQSTRYEVTLMGRDDRRVAVEITTRLMVEHRHVVGVHGIARDVSERQRAEATLRDIAMGIAADTGTDLFRSLVQSLAQGLGVEYAFVATLVPEEAGPPTRARTIALWAHDRIDDDIEYALAGTPCADVATTGLRIHVDRVRELFPEDLLAREMGAESYAGAPLRSSDGAARGIIAVAGQSPIREPGLARSMLQIFAVRAAAELEQMRTASALRDKENELQQALKMEALGRMAGGIAHDFNNLLTVVNGFAELALMRVHDDDADRKDFEQILAAGQSAARLTEQLLTFSRRETQASAGCGLSPAARGARALLRGLVRDHHVVEMQLSDVAMEVPASLAQIEQVLMNLVVNAVDAMPDGGRLRVTTRPCDEGTHGVLEVSDDGTGMDEPTRALAMEPFFTTKGTGAGTGLGLSTVYGIVQQTGGAISIESHPEEGTSVQIRWPLVEVPVDRSDEESTVAPPTGGRERILVVEDQEMVSHLASRALENRGYEVLCAGSTSQALTLLREADLPIDLVLSDVIMPGSSGVELAETLRTHFPSIRVLLMSGYNDVVEPGEDAGYGFLAKPFTPDELTRAVRERLDGLGEAAEAATT